jgi:hypothetical protein
VLPHEVRVLERSSTTASAVDRHVDRAILAKRQLPARSIALAFVTPRRSADTGNSRNAGGDAGAAAIP